MTTRSHNSLAEQQIKEKQNKIKLIAFFFSLSFAAFFIFATARLEDNNQLFIYVKLRIPQCAALKIAIAT